MTTRTLPFEGRSDYSSPLVKQLNNPIELKELPGFRCHKNSWLPVIVKILKFHLNRNNLQVFILTNHTWTLTVLLMVEGTTLSIDIVISMQLEADVRQCEMLQMLSLELYNSIT